MNLQTARRRARGRNVAADEAAILRSRVSVCKRNACDEGGVERYVKKQAAPWVQKIWGKDGYAQRELRRQAEVEFVDEEVEGR